VIRALFVSCLILLSAPLRSSAELPRTVYTYTLQDDGTLQAYDEAMAAASLQGIINRERPELYLLSKKNPRPQYWLDVMSQSNRWLSGAKLSSLASLDAVAKLAGKRLRGAVVWDTNVPATINVATTVAGVKDGVVLSPEIAQKFIREWNLPVLADLRGKFTGKQTGSSKNDAYRWAIKEYLAQAKCSAHRLCLYEDAWTTRAHGDIGYVLTRDWAVKDRCFVFDLSPWGDEKPADDPEQRTGLDLDTYKVILEETLHNTRGKQTELAGFFAFSKYAHTSDHTSAHEPVPTEWETVWLISPYNVYQNTIASDCYNQSLHSHAPRSSLKQRAAPKKLTLEKKSYICVLMADYDSATPLYDFLPKHWNDPKRGTLPLAWGVNPNLVETFPDIFEYLYSTASELDTFTADASAAGYMNPNRVQPQYLPLFIKHNQRFFRETDMTIAPMVLDWDQPTAAVKDAFREFAPGGFATIVLDMHGKGGHEPAAHLWKGMMVTELLNDTCNFSTPGETAETMARAIHARGNPKPGFYLFRIVWTAPSKIAESMELLRQKHPEIDFEMVGPREFFELFKGAQPKQN
jgi:hypothetical protein